MMALVSVAAAAVLAGCGSSKPTPASTTATTAKAPSVFTVRPVLCQAPAFAGGTPATGALPACAAGSALTSANLEVGPNPGNPNGYTSNTAIPPDPQFAPYPSTTVAGDLPAATVLLPDAAPAQGTGRFVLGPTAVTGASVQSASAQVADGQWVVNVTFTSTGSAAWDALAHAQFHAYVGVDLNAQVISATLIQPTTFTFTSFGGQLEISGASGQTQAQAWATAITGAH
jgi:hypothetical protein